MIALQSVKKGWRIERYFTSADGNMVNRQRSKYLVLEFTSHNNVIEFIDLQLLNSTL